MQVTDEMVERAKSSLYGCNGSPLTKVNIRAALTAALSAEQTQPVAVKALEWDQCGRANSEVGTYNIVCIAQGGVFGLWRPIDEGSTFPVEKGSEEHCRAAAQSDYESRIRSALVDVPAEPVAWRWKFDPDANWHYGDKEPKGFRFGDPEIVEALYPSPPLSREGEDTAEVILGWETPSDRVKVLSLARKLWNDEQYSCAWSDENREHYIIRAAMQIALAATRSGSAIAAKGCAE